MFRILSTPRATLCGAGLFDGRTVWRNWLPPAAHDERFSRELVAGKLTAMLLSVSVPSGHERGPQYAEQVLAALHGMLTARCPVSFEFGVHEATAGLFVRVPDDLGPMVAHHLANAYPDATIKRLPGDTLDPRSGDGIAACELRLTPDILPLKTYRHFEHPLSRTLADPVAGILSASDRGATIPCRFASSSRSGRHEPADPAGAAHRAARRSHRPGPPTGHSPVVRSIGHAPLMGVPYRGMLLRLSVWSFRSVKPTPPEFARLHCPLFEARLLLLATAPDGNETQAEVRLKELASAFCAVCRVRCCLPCNPHCFSPQFDHTPRPPWVSPVARGSRDPLASAHRDRPRGDHDSHGVPRAGAAGSPSVAAVAPRIRRVLGRVRFRNRRDVSASFPTIAVVTWPSSARPAWARPPSCNRSSSPTSPRPRRRPHRPARRPGRESCSRHSRGSAPTTSSSSTPATRDAPARVQRPLQCPIRSDRTARRLRGRVRLQEALRRFVGAAPGTYPPQRPADPPRSARHRRWLRVRGCSATQAYRTHIVAQVTDPVVRALLAAGVRDLAPASSRPRRSPRFRTRSGTSSAHPFLRAILVAARSDARPARASSTTARSCSSI